LFSIALSSIHYSKVKGHESIELIGYSMMRATLSFLALAASVAEATVSIAVGENGALKFDPDSVTAAVGDTLEFHFYSGSGGHSVVSSSFSTPCMPATDAFFSGYIPGSVSGDQTFVVTVNSTDPIWFYCSLATHCQAGMVGVVNPPAGQSVSDYAKAAQNIAQGSAPAAMQGGVLSTISPSAAMSTNTGGRQTSGAASTTVTSMTSSASGVATNTVGRESSGASTVTGTGTTSVAVSSNTVSRQGGSSTSASASVATTSKSAGVGRREGSDVGAVMGLAVFAGGLVALMA